MGDWNGTINAGPTTFHIVLHVKAKGSDYTGTMDSPDQGAKDITLSNVTFTDGALKFTAPGIGGAYNGKLDADQKSITGSWKQGPVSLPLSFNKA